MPAQDADSNRVVGALSERWRGTTLAIVASEQAFEAPIVPGARPETGYVSFPVKSKHGEEVFPAQALAAWLQEFFDENSVRVALTDLR